MNYNKFPEYHKDNPHIYEAFKKITFMAINKGHKDFSAEFVFNVIRWETNVSAKGYDEYKVNNNYKAFYSRMFMDDFPAYKGIFKTRRSRYD